MKSCRTEAGIGALSGIWLMALCIAGIAPEAKGFAGIVSPARFELKAKPGQVMTNVIEVGNDASEADEFLFQTADWELNADGGVSFQSEVLKIDSCRPWVRIERRSTKFAPHGSRKFRFEVHIPADSPARECRFALLIESASNTLPTIVTGNLRLPLQGRIGVIVYVTVGDVTPKMAFKESRLEIRNGVLTPIISVSNSGLAHGRLEGVLTGTDRDGQTFDLSVSNLPILPGETRDIPIWVQDKADGKTRTWAPPLHVRGEIEWEGGKKKIYLTLNRP